MRSRHADYFNHDEDAPGYDRDVLNEKDPIRKGYNTLLRWVGQNTGPAELVLDLGCGTGNTILNLRDVKKVIGVDVSGRMLELARSKTYPEIEVEFIQRDLLEYFDTCKSAMDAVCSTYAIHHLLREEKQELFQHIYNVLKPGGKAVFGDLMFMDQTGEKAMRARYPGLAESFDEEYYWNLSEESATLRELGFRVENERFSRLSFGIIARKGK